MFLAANDAEASEPASGFPRDGERDGASVDSCLAARGGGTGGGGLGNPGQALENARFEKGNERKYKCPHGYSALRPSDRAPAWRRKVLQIAMTGLPA